MGIEYLHGRSVVHRDLKSPNILLDSRGRAKISDFNLSKILDDSINNSSMAAMNPRWLAPELFDGARPTMACDIFSFGVILWEIVECDVPWGAENPWIIVSNLRSGKRLQIHHNPKMCPLDSFQRYSDLMEECCLQDPALRPTIHKVLASLAQIK